MARTQGHGNPNWTRDETILALDLYLELNGDVLRRNRKRSRSFLHCFERFLTMQKQQSSPRSATPTASALS